MMPFCSSSVSLVLPLLVIVHVFSFCTRCMCGNVVTHLPGFAGKLPFQFETGYVGIDESNDTQLFYYFIESEGNPREDPILVWLTGGPGCTAFSGLVYEIGPMKFRKMKYDGSLPTLFYFPYAWTKVSSIIFLDTPVGGGFSFSRRPDEYVVSDISLCKQVYMFLRKWFIEHPQYLPNRFYVAGDSLAGKFVPIVAHEVMEGIEAGVTPLPNLEGYVIGNPATGELVDLNSRIPYAHNMGIISDELYEITTRNCADEDFSNPRSALCATLYDMLLKSFSEINVRHILEPKCPQASPKPKHILEYRRSLEEEYANFVVPPPVPPLYCRSYAYYLSYYWANAEAVRHALHIQEGTVEEWERCSTKFSYTTKIKSNLQYQRHLLSRGYRAVVYSGDHDLAVPFIGTKEWIKLLNFTVVDDWRSWHVGGQVAGYTVAYSNNLTFATVKGGGHTAPEFRPEQCLAMITRWLSDKPL